MTKQEFMKSKPIELSSYGKAYLMRRKAEDENMWMQGQYNLAALHVVFSHFAAGMAGKQSKAEYPKNPISYMKKNNDFTEEELQEQREMFVAMLRTKKANFDLKNKSKSD